MERLAASLAGRYRVERELGAGGMATVYLAHDLKHDRDVAIKVLHPDLGAALGGDRFLTEIKTTAKLQHPHILPLLDSGEADGLLYYVMPYVAGETLRSRLERESQLPIEDAVRIASEIADALGAAHAIGIIHRDVKPENVLLQGGHALVADFGIALAVQQAAGQRMTQTGLSLGTPQYMSPEQAMGERQIDARADVYALGALTYEMLTGDAPFTGATVQAIVAKVLSAEPQRPSLVRKTIPSHVEAAVLTALAKLPADRFATAAEFGAALRNPGFQTAIRAAHPSASRARTDRRLVAALSAIVAISLGVGAWGWLRPTSGGSVLRYQMQLPATLRGVAAEDPLPLPSPDGSYIVYSGPRPGRFDGSQLWIKRRESRSATPIPGTVDAHSFTLSPDGAWIAFVLGAKVVKLPIAGGTPVTLVSGGASGANGAFGLTWLDDGTIVYTHVGAPRLWLTSVSASGGATTDVWKSDTSQAMVLGSIGGTHVVLFRRCASFALAGCDLWAVDLARKRSSLVLPGIACARYAGIGQLVYAQEGRLMAVGFDPGTFAVGGQPVMLSDTVSRGEWPFELSRSGTLVIRIEDGSDADPFEMVWVDRAGRATPVDTTWKFALTRYAADHGWALSPDGSRLAIGIYTEGGDQIWVKQLPHGPFSRLSTDPSPQLRPSWSHDGHAVNFVSIRFAAGFYQHRADGLGADSALYRGSIDEGVLSPDGSWLVARAGSFGSIQGGRDISGARLGVDTALVPLIVTQFDEEAIKLSPDGRWLAYQSDESGRTEVFVRSFPNTGAFKYQVSNGGGTAPLWSRDGHELYFVSAAKEMMAARVSAGPSLSVARPAPLFHIPNDLLQVEYAFYTPWDVAADGRFIMARARHADGANAKSVVVAENWLTELKARVKQ